MISNRYQQKVKDFAEHWFRVMVGRLGSAIFSIVFLVSCVCDTDDVIADFEIARTEINRCQHSTNNLTRTTSKKPLRFKHIPQTCLKEAKTSTMAPPEKKEIPDWEKTGLSGE